MNTKHRLAASPGLFLTGCWCLACFLYFLWSLSFNQAYFSRLRLGSLLGYEAASLAAILLLFAFGWCLLEMQAIWRVLLAFPMGICLWCFCGFVLLLLGIPFTMTTALGLCVLVLLLRKLLPRLLRPIQSKRISEDMPQFSAGIPAILLFFLGWAFLVSAGGLYSFVSYDSYYYFTNYGRSLAILGNFAQTAGNNAFTLTNISQFLPILTAYTSFWGLDQCYQLQAFLAMNIAAAFGVGLWIYTKKRWFAALFTLLLITSTSFLVISSWILANMYCMAYLFLFFLLYFIVKQELLTKAQSLLPMVFCLTALAMLRKDGFIFAAFLMLLLSADSYLKDLQLALLFLPAACAEILWLFYVRVVVNATTRQGIYSAVTNNRNILFTALILGGVYGYLFIGHRLVQFCLTRIRSLLPGKKWAAFLQLQLSEHSVLLFGIFLIFLATIPVKGELIIDNVDFVIRNMFRHPSSWGISGLLFGILLALSLAGSCVIDDLHFLWSGYALLNLASYCMVESKAFWLNWDDSYNRVLLQIVPVFVFIMAVKIWQMLSAGQKEHIKKPLY